jgi:ubiquitin-activating enzyme E1
MPFWSGPKRAPDPVTFNASDDLTIEFISACSNLIAFNIGLPQVRDIQKIKAIAAAVPEKPYKPSAIKVETPEE